MGSEHPETAQSLNSLAVLYYEQGKKALHVSDFVDALDRDQRRIHVHHAQPHVGEPALVGHERVVELRGFTMRRYRGIGLRIAQAKRGRRNRFDARRAGQLGQCFQVGRGDVEALDDEVHVGESGKRPRLYRSALLRRGEQPRKLADMR